MANAGGFVTIAAASASPASGPSTSSSPMCDRSNSPTAPRTDRCSSRIDPYWTGIRQPAKSIIRAPSASCRPASGVSCTDSPTSASVTKPAPPVA